MWKDYFSFNKRQRNGIIVLSTLILIMLVWLAISNHIAPPEANIDFSKFRSEVSRSTIKDTSNHDVIMSEPAHTENEAGHKLNINTATIKELSKQPGISYFLAQAIVNYREQHGAYKQVEDLLKNVAIDKLTFNKISPYLTVN